MSARRGRQNLTGLMHDGPQVSVIMIFLDAERFIREAIESVFAQTLGDWELLLVDDGSTDGSSAVAIEYARRDPSRVRYLEHAGHQNRGMSASRNLGLSRARGRYVALLDADDVWFPQKLEQQVAILDSHPEAAMVYGPTRHWFGWTGEPEDAARDFVKKLDFRLDALIEPPELLLLCLQSAYRYPSTCSILVRRRAVDAVGGFEEKFKSVYEDFVFYTKVFLSAPVFVSSECWDMYRRHPDSHCAIEHRTRQTITSRQLFFDWLIGFLSERGVTDRRVWALVRRKSWRYRHPSLYRALTPVRGLLTLTGRRLLPARLRHRIWERWPERVEDFII